MQSIKHKYFGDRAFYVRVLTLVVPMILQNMVTNFVSMIDNIMVGQLGTEPMNGVSIVNQFIFIFNITMFGALAGPGIFGAQFHGKGDYKGHRATFQLRFLIVGILTVLFSIAYRLFDRQLIGLFISKEDAPQRIADTLYYGRQYMAVILFSLIFFMISQAYSSVIRECGETRIQMYASMTAVAVNIVLDYILILGHFGAPAMGVVGAALATVVAKAIEAAIVVIWAHTHKEQCRFLLGAYREFKMPEGLLTRMIIKGFPLLINEFFWAAGFSLTSQCYSVRGLDIVAARNIGSVMSNLFGVVYIQLGVATSILLGHLLGAGKLKEAREESTRLSVFSVVAGAVVGLLLLPFAFFFPMVYNTTPEIRALATFNIIVTATAMPMWSYTNSAYFTLRSGGRTGITFLFDFIHMWFITIPLAYCLAHFTNMDYKLMFIVVTYAEMIKVVIGFFVVKSGMWIRNIVA